MVVFHQHMLLLYLGTEVNFYPGPILAHSSCYPKRSVIKLNQCNAPQTLNLEHKTLQSRMKTLNAVNIAFIDYTADQIEMKAKVLEKLICYITFLGRLLRKKRSMFMNTQLMSFRDMHQGISFSPDPKP